MSNIEYNTDFLIKIQKVFDFESEYIYYTEDSRILGLKLAPKGFWLFPRSIGDYIGSKLTDLPEHYHFYIKEEDKDKKVQPVYFKPHVTLYYIDGSYKDYFFEPGEENKAQKFADKFTVDKNWI